MNTLVNRNADLSRLDSLAQEARTYAANATMYMLQLGRVFIEAKELLKHGEFAAWCDENAGCSMRTVQNMMNAYKRFGEKQEFLSIGKTKLLKLLTLPEGTEEQFVQDNDIANMSSREIESAIREARGSESDKKTVRETETEAQMPIDEKLVDELRTVKEERDRIVEQNKELLEARKRLNDEIKNIKSGSELDADLIQTQQNTIDQLNDELNRYRVAEARGESGRSEGNDMDAEAFRLAVHEFMGSVHQVPSMGSIFATMDNGERLVFDTLLKSVEAWVKGARRAIDTIEGGFVS